jgi:replicative DNA helicase
MGTQELPNSRQTEENLIASLLIDPDAILRIGGTGLVPEDFYTPGHKLVYKVIQRLAAKGEAVDLVTVGNALEQVNGKTGNALDYIGGRAELSRMVALLPTTIYAADYARDVRDLAFRRNLIGACTKIITDSYNHEGTRDALQQTAAETFGKAVQVEDEHSHLYGTDEALLDYLVRQQERQEQLKRDPFALVTTPWSDVNRLLIALDVGMVQVIAARPGVGKTIWMENVAEYNAQRNKAIAFYHLELSHQFMLDRRMARWSGVTYDELRKGENGEKVERATDAIRQWQKNMTYIHCPGWSAERIMADAARLQAEGKADIVIIDYLQKLAMPESRYRNEASIIGGQVAHIKDAAERLGFPVFLGCQVTRDLKQRGATGRAQLTDLYGSGMIEAYSNQVCILHVPTMDDDEGPYELEPRELYVDKNTQGALGMVNLAHRCGRFRLEQPARGQA